MEPFVRRRCRRHTRRSSNNLFCRFPPHTLQALLQDAAVASNIDQTALQEGEGWTLSSSGTPLDDLERVEFLPLEIETADGAVQYASYNGGLLHMGSSTRENVRYDAMGDDWVELPDSLGFDCHSEYVSIRILPAVVDATEIRLEPLTENDYTSLQTYADWLESGGLLQQTSLVYQDQVLEIRLVGGRIARAQVVDVDGSLDGNREATERSEFEWPDDGDAKYVGNIAPLCRRLVADARIVVLDPKQHEEEESQAGGPIRLWPVPSWQDYGPPMHALAKQMQHPQLCIVPYGVGLVHPGGPAGTLLSKNHGGGTLVLVSVERRASDPTPTVTQTEISAVESLLIRLEFTEHLSPDCIALHPLQSLVLRLDPTSAEFSVLLIPLTSFEVQQRSSQLLDWLESGEALLQLNPIRLVPLAGSSHCLVELLKHPKNLDSEMAGVVSPPSQSPLAVGSLLFWGNKIRQIELIFSGENGPLAGKNLSLFLFGHDFVQLAKQENSPVLIPAEVVENVEMLAEPTTPPPRFLDLLPEATISPSKFLLDCPKSWGEFSMMLHGPPGCGKTRAAFVLGAIARLRYDASTVYLDCRAEKNAAPQLEHLLRVLTNLIDSANSNGNRPCLVILDDLDEICPNLIGQGGPSGGSSSAQSVEQTSPVEVEQAKVVSDHIRNLFDNVNTVENLAVVVTARDHKSVSWTFSRHHFLTKTFQLPLLDPREKVTLLEKLLQVKGGQEVPSVSDESQSSTSLPFEFRLHDLLPRDIDVLSSRILKEFGTRGGKSSGSSGLPSIVQEVLETYIPLSRRSAAEEPRDFFWDWKQDLGGLFEAKQALVNLIVRPMRFRRIYSTSRIRLPKGILLFGPPGCGKSIAPAALAKELGLPLILCRGPEILDKYIGASEAKVRELFERANLSAPSILFLDEIDALAPHRGSDLTGVTDRVVNQLLTFLDGVEDVSSGKTVYVMASSSRPDKIDSALLRPGRLEKHVYLGHPETKDELLDVFAKVASKYPLEHAVEKDLLSGRLLERCHLPQIMHMSPSDIKSIFDTAQIKAVRDFLSTGEDPDKAPPCVINESHLLDALQSAREGISKEEVIRLQEIYDRFRHKTSRSPDAKEMVQRVALK